MPSYAPAGAGPASLPHAPAAAPAGYGAMPAFGLASPAALAGATMGTTWSARLAVPPGITPAMAEAAIQNALDTVVRQMSTWDDGSDLSRFNRAAAGWQPLPAQCLYVLRHALELACRTDGAYDPTIGPLVNAWGFGPPPYASEPPSADMLRALMQRVGWQRITLDERGGRAWQPGGACLDLCGIAKGYGVDHAAAALDGLGISHYLIDRKSVV